MRYLLLFLWLVVYFNLIVSDEVSIYVMDDQSQGSEILTDPWDWEPAPIIMGVSKFDKSTYFVDRFDHIISNSDSCVTPKLSDSLFLMVDIYPL